MGATPPPLELNPQSPDGVSAIDALESCPVRGLVWFQFFRLKTSFAEESVLRKF
jgi:hypothetical protein